MEEKEDRAEAPFAYMEELSRAYQEAFLKRLEKKECELSPEKREYLLHLQWELSRAASRLSRLFVREEKKELSHMVIESADEILTKLQFREESPLPLNRFPSQRVEEILIRSVLLANRSLNLLLRHGQSEDRFIFLVLSEISALYAIASIR